MFAFPVIFIGSSGKPTYYDGGVVSAPDTFMEHVDSVISASFSNAKSGWFFHAPTRSWFFQEIQDGNRLVVPGLHKDKDEKFRFIGDDYVFEKKSIEDSIADIFDFQRKNEERISQDLNILIHDVRSMSGKIYHAALDAKRHIAEGNFLNSLMGIESILSLHSMLKLRTDMLDVMGNTEATVIENKYIEIWKGVSSVCDSIRAISKGNSKSILFRKNSNLLVYGPDIIEILAYILIDNAIKYAPDSSDITVSVFDVSNVVNITVKSLGPRIEKSEYQEIFEKRKRGIHAKNTGVNGTGYGLFLLRSTVEEQFGGIVSVEQDEESTTNNGTLSYYDTRFRISLPVREIA